jgi:hypothetical protein
VSSPGFSSTSEQRLPTSNQTTFFVILIVFSVKSCSVSLPTKGMNAVHQVLPKKKVWENVDVFVFGETDK